MRFPCVCNFSFLDSFFLTGVFITKGLLLPRIRSCGQEKQISTGVLENRKNTIEKTAACERLAVGLYWERQRKGNE